MNSNPQSAQIRPSTSPRTRQLFRTRAGYVLWFWIFVSFVLLKMAVVFPAHLWIYPLPPLGHFELYNEAIVATVLCIFMTRLYRATRIKIERAAIGLIQLDFLICAIVALQLLGLSPITIPRDQYVRLMIGVALVCLSGIRIYAVTHTKGNPWIPFA
jgi:hypothetical protein